MFWMFVYFMCKLRKGSDTACQKSLYSERDWNQGARLGTEPWVMLRRKMKNFESAEDAEAFARQAGMLFT